MTNIQAFRLPVVKEATSKLDFAFRLLQEEHALQPEEKIQVLQGMLSELNPVPLDGPYSLEDLQNMTHDDPFVEGVVRLDFSDIIDRDHEYVLDTLSTKLIARPILMQIEYELLAVEGPDTLLVRVSGDASHALPRKEENQ